MALNDQCCADVLRPLDLVPLTDFTYKYYTGNDGDDVDNVRWKVGQMTSGDDVDNVRWKVGQLSQLSLPDDQKVKNKTKKLKQENR